MTQSGLDYKGPCPVCHTAMAHPYYPKEDSSAICWECETPLRFHDGKFELLVYAIELDRMQRGVELIRAAKLRMGSHRAALAMAGRIQRKVEKQRAKKRKRGQIERPKKRGPRRAP